MAKRVDRDSAQLLAHDRKVREKKDALGHRLNQADQPCVTASSNSSVDCQLNIARTAEGGSAQKRSANKATK